MAIYTLNPTLTTLEELFDEWVYTHAWLTAHAEGKPFVKEFAGFLPQWRAAYEQELSLRMSAATANASVVVIDYELNDLIDRLVALARLQKEVDSTELLKRYLTNKSPSEIKRPILGEQLSLMKKIAPSLQAESDSGLQQCGADMGDKVKEAEQREAAQQELKQKLSDFRATTRRGLVEALNALRKKMHGALSELPHTKKGLPSDLADRFFMHETTKTTSEVNAALREAQAKRDKLFGALEAQDKKIAELQARKATFDAEAAEEEAARLAHEQAKKTLAEAKKTVASTRAKTKKK
jgi:hypothetical protein